MEGQSRETHVNRSARLLSCFALVFQEFAGSENTNIDGEHDPLVTNSEIAMA